MQITTHLPSSFDNDIALVPTMGALHNGHLSLIKKASELSKEIIISIFVNPTQFGQNEDLDKYPKNLDKDLALIENFIINENIKSKITIYTPDISEIYNKDDSFKIEPGNIAKIFEGEFRPQFFYGVCLVVLKLLMITKPKFAIFGEKDFQQLYLIKKMVAEFKIGTFIIACPTIREDSGLAMSSRNSYLSINEKNIAKNLYYYLNEIKRNLKALDSVNKHDIKTIIENAKENLLQKGFTKIDYIELINEEDFSIISNALSSKMRLLSAAFIGNTRLIDNISC